MDARRLLGSGNVPLRDLLQDAYDIRREQIFGLPAWAESTRFDINAKIADPDIALLKKLTPDQRRSMLRALLEDRFSVKWRYETRIMPVYELQVAKTVPS